MEIKQVFEPYQYWEDFKNGMWRRVSKQEEEYFLTKAIEFMGSHILFGKAMMRVINEWPVTCRHNLTDKTANRQAFMGQAACSLEINCPEYITRMAWGYLTNYQREKANGAADIAINKWERSYEIYLSKNNSIFIQNSLFETYN